MPKVNEKLVLLIQENLVKLLILILEMNIAINIALKNCDILILLLEGVSLHRNRGLKEKLI